MFVFANLYISTNISIRMWQHVRNSVLPTLIDEILKCIFLFQGTLEYNGIQISIVTKTVWALLA